MIKRLYEFHYSSNEIKETLDLVHLCVSQTAFIFNNVFYSLIEALGIGSPHSPLLCDIYMHYFEEKLFSVHKFPHWFGYVDDSFVLVPSNTDFSSLLSLVNAIDSCNQFTLEVESYKRTLFRFFMF